MKMLTKRQIAERDNLIAALNDACDELNDAFGELTRASIAYNSVVEKLNAWLTDVRATMTEYYDSRSARWRESQLGQGYLDWICAYEDELDLIEPPEPGATHGSWILDLYPASAAAFSGRRRIR